MRLRQTLRRELEAAAAQRHQSVAEIAQELLEEALRIATLIGARPDEIAVLENATRAWDLTA